MTSLRPLARSRPDPHHVADGIFDLKPGKIAAVATYLEMRARPAAAPATAATTGSWRFERIARDVGRYRRLYADVGQDWLWFSRTKLGDADLLGIIGHPEVDALAFVLDGQDAGLVELDFRQPRQCELSFLGLVANATGRGLGTVLIREAIGRAFARRIERLWLHTCTLDHPSALGFYMASGFTPFRRALEIADDPRLTGHLPRTAAPQLPLI